MTGKKRVHTDSSYQNVPYLVLFHFNTNLSYFLKFFNHCNYHVHAAVHCWNSCITSKTHPLSMLWHFLKVRLTAYLWIDLKRTFPVVHPPLEVTIAILFLNTIYQVLIEFLATSLLPLLLIIMESFNPFSFNTVHSASWSERGTAVLWERNNMNLLHMPVMKWVTLTYIASDAIPCHVTYHSRFLKDKKIK